MKKYILYHRYKVVAEGDNCNHHFAEFDTLTEAIDQKQNMEIRKLVSMAIILKPVNWTTVVRDVTNIQDELEKNPYE